MEVDNEYDWLMEEAGCKLVDGLLPVSKRQQRKGLGPSVYISSFNFIVIFLVFLFDIKRLNILCILEAVWGVCMYV